MPTINGKIPLIVHSTHEAGLSVGGIGAVLQNLLAAPSYTEAVERTVLVGPFNRYDATEMERLFSPRSNINILYCPLAGINQIWGDLAERFANVERTYGVAIFYGLRRFGKVEHEIILLDATFANPDRTNEYKYHVSTNFGFTATPYEYDREFSLFMKLAQPTFAAIKALTIDTPAPAFVIAHEWMGMPLVFAAFLNEPFRWYTAFYAHETATARVLVEGHPGHDTRFYNAMFRAREAGLNMDQVFGNRDDFFKHALLKQALRCNSILAVGDLVIDELRFLGNGYQNRRIDLVYNGVPSTEVSLSDKKEAKRKLQDYAQNLYGYRPDYFFTHVTRLVPSKAMWRDVRVLEQLDYLLQQRGQTAMAFLLTTSVPQGRRSEQVMAWEWQYNWPLGHRTDNGDLIGDEVPLFYDSVEPLNNRARALRVVLVNQYGWSQDRCGRKMPADMSFMDLRRGSDVEFGQSIYEPFGIAQVETLSYGTICVPSNACGCLGFVRRTGRDARANIVVPDYVSIPGDWSIPGVAGALNIGRETRDAIEGMRSWDVAQQIAQRLPSNDVQTMQLLTSGYELARQMSWDVVARDYLLPALYQA